MTARSDGPDVKAMLKGDMVRLVHALGLEGHRSGTYWMCRSRAHDRKIGGMYVTLAGGMAGAWVDAVAGEKGDVISLIGYIKFGAARGRERDAFAWARDFLGLGAMTPEQRERASQAAVLREKAESVRTAEELARNRKRAFAIWLDSKRTPFIDSVADRYLQSRRIHVRQWARLPGCLGWLPARHHIETGTTWPVMIAGFTDDADAIVALHITFLARDGSGKAPLPPMLDELGVPLLDGRGNIRKMSARKIWPSFKGAAIRLWRGESGLSVGDAAKHGLRETLVLAEGIEKCGASIQATPEYRTWSFGSLANLRHIRLPECVDRVLVWRDNDWSNPLAARHFEAGVAALQAQGREVGIIRAPFGKDADATLCTDGWEDGE